MFLSAFAVTAFICEVKELIYENFPQDDEPIKCVKAGMLDPVHENNDVLAKEILIFYYRVI